MSANQNDTQETQPRKKSTNTTLHIPYISGCSICNRAALKEDPHYRQTAEEIKKGLAALGRVVAERAVGQASPRPAPGMVV